MNPGKVVAPYRIDENLRLGASWSPRDYDSYFSCSDDDGRFERAVMRCVGVGKCRHSHGGVMCTSYMVTREEEHSTRGRSRLLFEMLEGHADYPVTAGRRSTEVRDALDLCLACKGCKKDCPIEVDMATMKAELLARHYAGRVRPRSHYSMGWLSAVAQVASRAPRLVNALTQALVLRDVLTTMGGIDRRRRIPLFADQTRRAWAVGRDPGLSGLRGEVVLWPDIWSAAPTRRSSRRPACRRAREMSSSRCPGSSRLSVSARVRRVRQPAALPSTPSRSNSSSSRLLRGDRAKRRPLAFSRPSPRSRRQPPWNGGP